MKLNTRPLSLTEKFQLSNEWMDAIAGAGIVNVLFMVGLLDIDFALAPGYRDEAGGDRRRQDVRVR